MIDFVFVPEDCWLTRDGRIIPITDLDDDHLDKILHFLDQRRLLTWSKYLRLDAERIKRRNKKLQRKLTIYGVCGVAIVGLWLLKVWYFSLFTPEQLYKWMTWPL